MFGAAWGTRGGTGLCVPGETPTEGSWSEKIPISPGRQHERNFFLSSCPAVGRALLLILWSGSGV